VNVVITVCNTIHFFDKAGGGGGVIYIIITKSMVY
jgi:hypothetical protein